MDPAGLIEFTWEEHASSKAKYFPTCFCENGKQERPQTYRYLMIKEIPSISSSYQDGKTVQYSLQKCYKFLHYCVVCKQPVVISFTSAEVFSAQQ